MVRVHHPLQQGLRPFAALKFKKFVIVRVHHPLQQGLRLLSPILVSTISTPVRVHHPLQQGLRPMDNGYFITT